MQVQALERTSQDHKITTQAGLGTERTFNNQNTKANTNKNKNSANPGDLIDSDF